MLVNTGEIVSIQKYGSFTSGRTANWSQYEGPDVVAFNLGKHHFQLVVVTDDKDLARTCQIKQGEKILLSFEGHGSCVFEGRQTNDTVELKRFDE
jgi:phage gp45-like